MPRRPWLSEAITMLAVLLLAAGLVKTAYELAGTTLWLAALRDAPWWTGLAGVAAAVAMLVGVARWERQAP